MVSSIELYLTTTLVQRPAFCNNLFKPVPECQTILWGFAAATEDGDGGGTMTSYVPVKSAPPSAHNTQVFLPASCPYYRPSNSVRTHQGNSYTRPKNNDVIAVCAII